MLELGLASSQQEYLAPFQGEVLVWVIWGVISQGGLVRSVFKTASWHSDGCFGSDAAGHRLDLFRIHQYSSWIFL